MSLKAFFFAPKLDYTADDMRYFNPEKDVILVILMIFLEEHPNPDWFVVGDDAPDT